MATLDRGPSYDFWQRIHQELRERGLSQRWLILESGVSHTVIRDLRTAAITNQKSRHSNVVAIAAALGIPRDEALQLAGLVDKPVDGSVTLGSVRDSIRQTGDLDDDQKDALYRLLDVFDRDRPRPVRNRDTS